MSIQQAYEIALRELSETITNPKAGYTSGFERIDQFARRMKKGQLWVVGGYSGVGKSYFALNMLDNILRDHPDLRVSVFSTELLAEDYIQRHMLMRAGVWESDLSNPASESVQKLYTQSDKYYEAIIARNKLQICGGIGSFEDIMKHWDHPDIAIIDFVQELSIGGRHEAKDALPIIATKLKELALSTGSVIIAVSQLSNAGQREKTREQVVAPFDYGKELNRAAHTAIVLRRDKLADGKLSMILQVNIFKARKGVPGLALMLIDKGFRIREAERGEIMNILEQEKLSTINDYP